LARIQKYQAEQMHYNAIAVKHALEVAGYKIYGLPLQCSKPYTRKKDDPVRLSFFARLFRKLSCKYPTIMINL